VKTELLPKVADVINHGSSDSRHEIIVAMIM